MWTRLASGLTCRCALSRRPRSTAASASASAVPTGRWAAVPQTGRTSGGVTQVEVALTSQTGASAEGAVKLSRPSGSSSLALALGCCALAWRGRRHDCRTVARPTNNSRAPMGGLDQPGIGVRVLASWPLLSDDDPGRVRDGALLPQGSQLLGRLIRSKSSLDGPCLGRDDDGAFSRLARGIDISEAAMRVAHAFNRQFPVVRI